MLDTDLRRAGRHKAENAPRWAHTILDAFRRENIRNLVFLPDTVMGRLLALAESDDFFRLTAVHREEDAVGIQHFTLSREDEVQVVVEGALKTCFTAQEPLAILISAQLGGWKDEE